MNRYLLDSHTLLRMLYEPEQLPANVATRLSDPESHLFVSLASLWEIANKAAFHRLPFVGRSIEGTLDLCRRLAISNLSVVMEDVLYAARLPLIHGDPFDRILVAQAQRYSLILVTRDKNIQRYNIAFLW